MREVLPVLGALAAALLLVALGLGLASRFDLFGADDGGSATDVASPPAEALPEAAHERSPPVHGAEPARPRE